MAVHVKPTARFRQITPELLQILAAILAADRAFPEDMVITSVNDSTHAVNSAHYRDLAIDLRCNDRPSVADHALHDFLTATLGPRFLVLLESPGTPNEHLHLQLRRGQIPQPDPTAGLA